MNSDSTLGKKVLKGTVWTSVDRFGHMGIQFVVNLVLANLLMPRDFGYIGMIAIFLTVSQVLIDGGFNTALIQKKHPDASDYATIFYWNMGLAIALYLILYATAPLIADFFKLPLLTKVLRVIGLTLITNAYSLVYLAMIRKRFQFKIMAMARIISYLISGSIAIWMAYTGWGVWSLVAMAVIMSVVTALVYQIKFRWWPQARFSITALRSLFGFGGYLLTASLLQEICRNLQGIIIGRRFSSTQMGYYSQAYKLDQISSYAVPQVLVQVMFPYFSEVQDDTLRMRDGLARSIRVIAIAIFPVITLVGILAYPLITGLYGAQWAPAAPYFRIMCVGGLFISLQDINFYAVAACGHSRTLFHWSFYKWGMLFAFLMGGMWIGMEGIVWATVLGNLNIYLVNAALVQRYVGYPMLHQLRSLLPQLACCAGAAACALFLPPLLMPDAHGGFIYHTLAALLFAGIYVGAVLLFRLRAAEDLAEIYRLVRSARARSNDTDKND